MIFRNMFRNKIYSLINIVGLSVGMAVVLWNSVSAESTRQLPMKHIKKILELMNSTQLSFTIC